MKNPITALRSRFTAWLARAFLADDLWKLIQKAFAQSLPTDNQRTLAQMQTNKGWAFAANRQIAGRAVRVRPQLFLNSRAADGEPQQTLVHDHPYLDLLAQPNCDEHGSSFHWRKIAQLNTAGAAFVKVVPETRDLGVLKYSRIRELRLLDPDRTRPIHWRDPNDPDRERFTAGYEFTPYDGGMVTYLGAPYDRESRERWKADPYAFVYAIPFPDPASIHGASPMQAAEHSVNVLHQLGVMHVNQLAKGLHADLVFYLLKDIDDPERFKQAALMVMAGVNRAGEPLVVPKKLVEVAQSGRGNKDMEFVALAESMRQQLLGVLGASDAVVGLSEDVNRASVEGLERIFALGTIDPLNSLIADADNAWLLPLFSGPNERTWYTVKYGTSAGVDDLSLTEMLVKQTAGAPIKTQNEARKSLGLSAKPEGDALPAVAALQQLPALTGNAAKATAKSSNGHSDVLDVGRCPRCRRIEKDTVGPSSCCGLERVPEQIVLLKGAV